MVKRFFLDWIDTEAAGTSVSRQDNGIILSRTDKTETALTFFQAA
jgi:hypothetical protein